MRDGALSLVKAVDVTEIVNQASGSVQVSCIGGLQLQTHGD